MRETLEALVVFYRDRCDLTAARREHLLKRNALLDSAIARENRSVVTTQEVDEKWAYLVLLAVQKFRRIGNKLASRITYLKDEASIAQEIDKEVDEALRELARPIDYDGNRPPPSETIL